MKFKMERVDLDIKNALSVIISQMNDRRISDYFVTISDVKTSPDLSSSKISIEFLSGDEEKQDEIINVLNSSKGYLKKELANRIKIRRVPNIFFVKDRTEERASRIEALLARIKK